MKLNTYILAEYLKKKYKCMSKMEFLSPTLCSFAIFQGGELRSDIIYVIGSKELLKLGEYAKQFSFICIAEKDCSFLDYDVICLEGEISLHEVINTLAEIFRLYNEWESLLSEYDGNHESLRVILNKSRVLLHGAIIVADYYFKHLAFSNDFREDFAQIQRKYGEQTPDYVVEEILTDPAYYMIQNIRTPFVYPVHRGDGSVSSALCYNLFRPKENVFYMRLIFIGENNDYSERERYLLKILGDRINRMLCHLPLKSRLKSSYNNLRETVNAMIKGQIPSGAVLKTILREVGWMDDDQYALIKFVPEFLLSKHAINTSACNLAEMLYRESCAIVYDEFIVLLINTSRCHLELRDIVDERFRSFIRESLYKVGISSIFQGLSGTASAYNEASAALRIGSVKNNMFWYYFFEDYAMEYVIEKSSSEISKESLCNQGLMRLIKYDRENDTQYAQVLRTYFECRYNTTHAAGKLYIHRSTLLKYLEKIEQITNLDLKDFSTRIHVMLSYRILESSM